MNGTTKYILIGGGAIVAVVLVARRMAAAQSAASKPTGLAGAIAGATQAYDSLKSVSWSFRPADTADNPLLDHGGMPYGPGVSPDPHVAVSDAKGTRLARATIPTETKFYDARLAGIRARS